MVDGLTGAELAQRFAEETDAIARRGATPNCAEQLARLQAKFDTEYTRMLRLGSEPNNGHDKATRLSR